MTHSQQPSIEMLEKYKEYLKQKMLGGENIIEELINQIQSLPQSHTVESLLREMPENVVIYPLKYPDGRMEICAAQDITGEDGLRTYREFTYRNTAEEALLALKEKLSHNS